MKRTAQKWLISCHSNIFSSVFAADSYSGFYENTHYEDGGKNEYHYVTVSMIKGKKYVWRNAAGVTWALYKHNNTGLRVGRNCPYYKNGYTFAKFTKNGVYGPGNEFYKKESKNLNYT